MTSSNQGNVTRTKACSGRSAGLGLPAALGAAAALIALLLALLPAGAAAAPTERWRSRTIYQLLTDRFAPHDCWGGAACSDLDRYCGGTFSGIQKMSSHITELGFDAVWLSPITLQGADLPGASGYHGYWPQDLYQINPAFGSQQDLLQLMRHLHEQGMLVMFDQVINHMGYGDVGACNPFNKTTDFHDCNGCLGLFCEAGSELVPGNLSTIYTYEHCKMSGLPDLNHSDPSVLSRMQAWFEFTLHTYQPDALRLDAAGHSLPSFCAALTTVFNNTFTVGELFLPSPSDAAMQHLAGFVRQGASHGVFAFPMQIVLEKVFRERLPGHDLVWLAGRRQAWLAANGERAHDMLTFVDNHDVPRWLHANYSSVSRFMNALSFVLFLEGIPVVYYGTEEGMTDPQLHPPRADPRAPLWETHYSHSHPLWLFLRTSIAYRKQAAVWDAGVAQTHLLQPHYMVLSRGPLVLVLTDVGEDGPPAGTEVLMLQELPERFRSRTLDNIYQPQDKLSVSSGGVGLFRPDPEGRPQVFFLHAVADPRSFLTPGPLVSSQTSSAVFVFFLAALGALLLGLGLLHLHTIHRAPSSCPCCQGRRARATQQDSPSCSGASSEHDPRLLCYLHSQQSTPVCSASRPATSASLLTAASAGSGFKRSLSSSPAAGTASLVSAPSVGAAPAALGEQAAATAPPGSSSGEGGSFCYTTTGSSSRGFACSGVASMLESPFSSAAVQTTLLSCNSSSCGSSSAGDEAGPELDVCGLHDRVSSAFNPGPDASSDAQAADVLPVASRASSPALLRAPGPAMRHPVAAATAASCSSASLQRSLGSSGLLQASGIICHAALEFSIPSLGFNTQLMYGGMGLVVDAFIQHWPGPMALIAPLYAPCYATPLATAEAGASGRPAGAELADRPSWLPADHKPLLSLTVDVAGSLPLAVDVFKWESWQESATGQRRVFYLVQADLFRLRDRHGMYAFDSEAEMLAWLAVFNKAVAAVVAHEGISHLQLHDYHAALSLLYLPPQLRPAVMMVAHNAHYDATFPIPTAERRKAVYAALNLNPELAGSFLEHQGRLDVLRAAVQHMRHSQQGRGVVAVSPRYAEQIREKLSVLWHLAPVGRPSSIIGILNSLDMPSSLAFSGLSLERVLQVKGEAKAELQRLYGLEVGPQFSLATFVGRMTHQKGVDIIAEVAGPLMARHPLLQLVVVGPTGDPVGAAASAALAQLSSRFPGRMFCPQDHYVAGSEKQLLLQATDFCLLPSRFEPCGLVDVEFGWAGSLIIGHDTGGLGKMPGVYFRAQAIHLSHLARQFEAAVGRAMGLSLAACRAQQAEALARRFPVQTMMSCYYQAWLQIDQCRQETLLSSPSSKQQRLTEQAAFFAAQWSRCNKKDSQRKLVAPASAAVTSPAGSSDESASRACPVCAAMQAQQGQQAQLQKAELAGSSRPSLSSASASDAAGCTISVASLSALAQAKGKVAAEAAAEACSCSCLAGVADTDSNSSEPWVLSAHKPAAQRLSDLLLVVLQCFAMGPGMVLLSFRLLQEVLVNARHGCGTHFASGSDLLLPRWATGLGPQLLGFFFLSTVFAPLWFVLAARCWPVVYIRSASVVVFLSYGLAFLALHFNPFFSAALAVTAATNLAASPIISIGMLGEEDISVFEVGRTMLALSEGVKYGLLCACMATAAAAAGPMPSQVLAGVCMLLAAGMLVWFCLPHSLSRAYQHLALTFSGQARLLAHLSCFWLSLVAATCDGLALLLTAFLVVATTHSLATLAAYQAIAFAASGLAVAWNCLGLRLRAVELHLNAAVMLLAAMPFAQLLKAAVLMTQPGTAVLLACCGMIDLVMGGRSSVLGLAGFVTLPSREVVAIWQFSAIALGSVSALCVVGAGYVAGLSGQAASPWLLFGLVGGAELVRLACCAAMAVRYPRENLSAP